MTEAKDRRLPCTFYFSRKLSLKLSVAVDLYGHPATIDNMLSQHYKNIIFLFHCDSEL